MAYNLTFKTGDMLHAGTDANVTLQLYGDKGQTEKIMLRQDKGKTLQRFDRGRTDRFIVQAMDVGTVRCNEPRTLTHSRRKDLSKTTKVDTAKNIFNQPEAKVVCGWICFETK